MSNEEAFKRIGLGEIEPNNNVLLRRMKWRNRWAFFTEPSISLIGAMIYVAIGFAIGSFL